MASSRPTATAWAPCSCRTTSRLNKDFRYQLTVVGQLAQAMWRANSDIASYPDRQGAVKVSWQVTASARHLRAQHRIQSRRTSRESGAPTSTRRPWQTQRRARREDTLVRTAYAAGDQLAHVTSSSDREISRLVAHARVILVTTAGLRPLRHPLDAATAMHADDRRHDRRSEHGDLRAAKSSRPERLRHEQRHREADAGQTRRRLATAPE